MPEEQDREIEVKFEVDHFDYIRRCFGLFCTELVWQGEEINMYFDQSNGVLKGRGEMLRLKEWRGHSIELTFKGRPSGDERFIEREELQVGVNNFNEMKKILERLGYSEVFGYKKQREHWVLPLQEVSIELDTLEDGRHFVEIEGAKDQIEAIAEYLALDWNCATTKSYPELLVEGV